MTGEREEGERTGEWRNYSQGTEEKGLPVRPKKIRVGGGGKIAPGENGGRNWERRRGKVDGLRSNERIFLFALPFQATYSKTHVKRISLPSPPSEEEGAGGMPLGEKRVFDVFLAEGIGSHCFYAFPSRPLLLWCRGMWSDPLMTGSRFFFFPPRLRSMHEMTEGRRGKKDAKKV